MAKSAPTAASDQESVEELVERGKQRGRKRLSLDEIADLEAVYKDVATASDDDAKSIVRGVIARLRRTTHQELHPDCKRVEITVPRHPTGVHFAINEKPYQGRCEVWECEARQLLSMIQDAKQVEAERMRESGRTIDLDGNAVADRIRQIQEA